MKARTKDRLYAAAAGIVKSSMRRVGLDIRRVRTSGRALETHEKELLSSRFKNYNLGCGLFFAEDFLNIDLKLDMSSGRDGVPIRVDGTKNAYALSYDMTHGLPAGENSLSVIYHCHFLEHLSSEEGFSVLSDCFRCLAPGGVMRLALPDLELWCQKYVSKAQDFFDLYRHESLSRYYPEQRSETNGMALCTMFYNWGHRMMYDYESLQLRLTQIGFVDVRRMKWGDSECVPQVPFFERAGSHYERESVVIECRKPPLP